MILYLLADKFLKSKSEFESTNLRQQNALARGLTTPPQFPQTDNNKWPEWSLPPPEGHQREKRLSVHDDQDFGEQSRSAAVSTAKREDSFSCLADNSTLSESPTTDEMVQSPPERSASGTVSGETETPHNDIAAKMRQSCFEKQDCSTLMANQEKKENGHVSNNAALLATEGPLLTSSVDFVARSSSSENLNSQQSRIPAEQDDNVGDIGLLEEMSKVWYRYAILQKCNWSTALSSAFKGAQTNIKNEPYNYFAWYSSLPAIERFLYDLKNWFL